MNNKDKSKPSHSHLPKGAYRLPTGGFVTESSYKLGKRRITIYAVRKDPPDIEKLARAFIRLVEQQTRRETKTPKRY